MTEKLYLPDPDLIDFTAVVTACEPCEQGFQVVLDRTAFFPEGGGQGADHGTLEGVPVTDVHEKGGVIFHLTTAPLQQGALVHGHVDPERRLDMMQQHSGEHIFSGLVCHTYDCSNVGFHIGTDAVTMDFDYMLTEQDALDIERRANEVIWANLPVRAWIPDPEELAATEYRSKKELEGDVRLVRIPGVDTCACCGTHVQTTGRVGQVKLLGVQKYKKGVRVSILCGRRALAYENLLLEQVKRVANALSGKPLQIADAVDHLLQERDSLRETVKASGFRLFEQQALAEQGRSLRVVECAGLDASMLRKAAGQLAEGCTAAIVLIPRDGGWQFACSSQAMDIRPLTKSMLDAFGGRGGGPADMTQGSLLRGTAGEIRALAEQLTGQA